MPTAPAFAPEALHPSLWRASQLAQASGRVCATGHAALSAELPGGGWPVGALVELLAPRPGIGELRLLQPALRELGKRPVVLVQPPHVPNAPGLAHTGLSLANLLWLRAPQLADALWSIEQILRAGTCGAVLAWLPQVPTPALRRLHLAAQSSDTLLFALRPLTCAREASPAVLRLALHPAADGMRIDIVKRRGPSCAFSVPVPLQPAPVLLSRHARPSRPASVPSTARSAATPVAV